MRGKEIKRGREKKERKSRTKTDGTKETEMPQGRCLFSVPGSVM
jgi:hypothetical protein